MYLFTSQSRVIQAWMDTILNDLKGRFIPIEDHIETVTVTFTHGSDPMNMGQRTSTFTLDVPRAHSSVERSATDSLWRTCIAQDTGSEPSA